MKEQEIIPGTPVRYWNVIMQDGEKLDPVNTTVTHEAWKLPSGHLVCMVADVRGCVSVSHLEKL